MKKENLQRGIVPRKIKGFRDVDANLNQLRWKIITAAAEVYKSYGFEHWETPVLEYADAIGKYMPDADSVEQGVYSFKNPEEEPVFLTNGREMRDEWGKVIMDHHPVALRYDLTAPLARVYAERLWMDYLKNRLGEGRTPLFRRFQFGPVYRYELKLSPGRFREFWQLDFDSVGTDDVVADAEVCMILSDALEAIGLKRGTYVVKVNDRKVLTGFLRSLGISEGEEEQSILRIMDKLEKIGWDAMRLELGKGRVEKSGAEIAGLHLDETLIDSIFQFLKGFTGIRLRKDILKKLQAAGIDNPMAQEGIEELKKIDEVLSALDFDESRVVFEPGLVRGMAYYTGPVFEVESLQNYVDEKGKERRVGSICGGGRYDGLVEKLLGLKVPATGASIGVDRLAELLRLTHQAPEKVDGPVLIAYFDDELMPEYQLIARELRMEGIEVEVYYGFYKGFRKMKKQLKYADEKRCPVVILIGENEAEKGVATVKNLKLGSELAKSISDKKEFNLRVQKEVKRAHLVSYVKSLLSK